MLTSKSIQEFIKYADNYTRNIVLRRSQRFSAFGDKSRPPPPPPNIKLHYLY